MTSYKADISVRFLVDSAGLSKKLAVQDMMRIHKINEAEAIRRLLQTWFEGNVLHYIKPQAKSMFGDSVSPFDNAIAKVQLD